MSGKSALVFLALGATSLSAADGRETFEQHCIACHGADGRARTPAGKKLGAKDLGESRLPDAEIEKQILDGVRDAKASHRMPPFREKLSRDEVAALVVYVKTFRK